jgi:hypothetical protein
MNNVPVFTHIDEALSQWAEATRLYPQVLYEKYKAHRAKYGCNAETACRWAKQKPQPKFIDTLPYSYRPTYVDVPGIGALKFELKDDNDYNSDDYDEQTFQWVKGMHDNEAAKHCGAKMGENMYSLNHWDHGSVAVLCFDKKSGGRFEDRYKYHARSMSKQDAYIAAQASIKDECEYRHRVAEGDVSWVGACVTLWEPGEPEDFNDQIEDEWKEIGQEEVWGFEYPDSEDYLLDTMNEWAASLVAKHWQQKYGCEAPMPGTQDVVVDAAWKAWHTSMVVSNNDRTIADPVFVSTYKEKLNAERFRTCRLVQARG